MLKEEIIQSAHAGVGCSTSRQEASVGNLSFDIQDPIGPAEPTFDDVTAQVEDVSGNQPSRTVSCFVFSQHTTCSVLIQEASDDINYSGTELPCRIW